MLIFYLCVVVTLNEEMNGKELLHSPEPGQKIKLELEACLRQTNVVLKHQLPPATVSVAAWNPTESK